MSTTRLGLKPCWILCPNANRPLQKRNSSSLIYVGAFAQRAVGISIWATIYASNPRSHVQMLRPAKAK